MKPKEQRPRLLQMEALDSLEVWPLLQGESLQPLERPVDRPELPSTKSSQGLLEVVDKRPSIGPLEPERAASDAAS